MQVDDREDDAADYAAGYGQFMMQTPIQRQASADLFQATLDAAFADHAACEETDG